MLITRTSILSGVETTLDIDVTWKQLAAWKAGALIQDVMPNVSPEEREFLISGITPAEWNKEFPAEKLEPVFGTLSEEISDFEGLDTEGIEDDLK